MEPAGPLGTSQKGGLDRRRDHRQGNGGQQEQRQRRQGNAGGVVPGKAGDEILTGGLFLPGVLHQVQNFGHSGLLAGTGDLHPQEARLIYAAADDGIAGGHIPGSGLTGEGGGIKRGYPLQHHAVQRHPLAGLYHHHGAHFHILRVHFFQLSVRPLQIGGIRADVHQGGDGLAGLAHGIVLEQLPHLVEEHNEHRLSVLPGAKGPHSGQGHEKVLVKDLSVCNIADGFIEHIPADDGIGNKVHQPQQGYAAGQYRRGQQFNCNQQCRRRNNPHQHCPLLAGKIFHIRTPPSKSAFFPCVSFAVLVYWRQSDGRL